MDRIPKVLFLSKGNASRAQIAEGFLRALGGRRFVAVSAGTESSGVSALAKEVMSEIGVDISSQERREIPSLFRETFRYAVVVCDASCERFPVYPFTAKLFRWSVPDPEIVNGGAEARLQAYRQVRDEIKNRVGELVETTNRTDISFRHAA